MTLGLMCATDSW